MWDLPIQQSEVLKIGRFSKDESNPLKGRHESGQSSNMTSLPDSSSTVDLDSGFEGLDFQRHCPDCGHALRRSIFAIPFVTADTPSTRHRQNKSIQRCSNCKPRQPLPTKLPCVICGEVVDGMLVPCLSCGHVSCFDCHRCWFLRPSLQFDGQSDPADTPPTCPSGCGCNCSEHVAADVAMPSWEPISPPQTTVGSPQAHPRSGSHDKRHRRRQSEPVGPKSGSETPVNNGSGVGQHEDDLDVWQTTSPFASLARGMGGGLSQGLQTKEVRKKNRSIAMPSPRRR